MRCRVVGGSRPATGEAIGRMEVSTRATFKEKELRRWSCYVAVAGVAAVAVGAMENYVGVLCKKKKEKHPTNQHPRERKWSCRMDAETPVPKSTSERRAKNQDAAHYLHRARCEIWRHHKRPTTSQQARTNQKPMNHPTHHTTNKKNQNPRRSNAPHCTFRNEGPELRPIRCAVGTAVQVLVLSRPCFWTWVDARCARARAWCAVRPLSAQGPF